MRYVLVGGSVAGIAAAEAIRSRDPSGEILMISDESYGAYARPLISHYLAGQVNDEQILYRSEDFYQRLRIDPRFGSRVTALDTDRQQVCLESGERIGYDRLLLAVGSVPVFPKIPGLTLEGVFGFRGFADARKLAEKADEVRRVVVIGGGFIGLVCAMALRQVGVQVTVLEVLSRLMALMLDERGAKLVQGRLEQEGVVVRTDTSVQKILGSSKLGVQGVILDDDSEIPADLVVVATGVQPNLDLVRDTAIRHRRGILVDETLQTNVPGVYAAGDVVEAYDCLRQDLSLNANWPCAYEQGRIAGLNMAGAVRNYQGGYAMNSLDVFGLPCISMGIVNPVGNGYEFRVKSAPGRSVYKKLVFHQDRLVGAICLGEITRAGVLNRLLREGLNVKTVKDDILEERQGYIEFLKRIDRPEMEGNVQWPSAMGMAKKFKKQFDEKRLMERMQEKG